MSDTVLIAIIIAVVLIITLLIFRRRLTRLLFRYKGIEAQLAAGSEHRRIPASKEILVTGNKQMGVDNTIETTVAQGEVSENKQRGVSNRIRVKKGSA